MTDFLSALIIVFIAEMGDKTQLLTMACAGKYRTYDVMTGITISIAALNGIAVLMGNCLSNIIPMEYIKLTAAVSFLIFGVFALKKKEQGGEKLKTKVKSGIGAIFTVASIFFLSEIGDKTQLMTITLAAQSNRPFLIFLGAFFAMVAADGIGVILGSIASRHFSEKIINYGASIIFITFGTITLYNVVKSKWVFLLNPIPIALYFMTLAYISFKLIKKSN